MNFIVYFASGLPECGISGSQQVSFCHDVVMNQMEENVPEKKAVACGLTSPTKKALRGFCRPLFVLL